MRLLCFAHYGEAQYFLDNLASKPSSLLPNNSLFDLDDAKVLITKEGIYQALHSVTRVLAMFPNIDEVWNFGVVGALNDQLQKYQLLTIRNVLCYTGEGVEFKSFYAHNKDTTLIRCVSSHQRRLNAQEKMPLQPFGDVVDRELWGVAYACHEYNRPWTSLKIVADSLNEDNFCEVVPDEGQLYSKSLFEHYCMMSKQPATHGVVSVIELPSDFYATYAQRKLLESLAHKLAVLYPSQPVWSPSELQKISQEVKKPKERTQKLIQILQERVNPFERVLRDKLHPFEQLLDQANVKVRYPPEFEGNAIVLEATVKNQSDFETLNTTLETFPYQEFRKVLNGEFDQ